MVTVTVTLPPVLENELVAREVFQSAIIAGMDAELMLLAGEIKASPLMPMDRGILRRSITTIPAKVTHGPTSFIVGWIVTEGEASHYGAVMDLGRFPGRRAPPLRRIREWVRRKMPDQIREAAKQLQTQYVTDHPGREGGDSRGRATRYTDISGKTISRGVEKFMDRAEFLMARAIQLSIAEKGIVGRQFAESKKPEIAARVRARIMTEIQVALLRIGLSK